MTESIAISSGKGGVGKTTIAVNLALTLSVLGKRTLLLDADLGMANSHFLLGVNPDKTLDEIVNNKFDINKIIMPINKKLDFISGGSAMHTLLNLDNSKRYDIIKKFNNLKKVYDYMIIDVGAGAESSSLTFMSAASKIITVLVSEQTSFADAYGVIKASFIEHNLENFGIIWNMSSSDYQAKTHFTKFQNISTKFLDVKLKYLGSLSNSNKIKNSIASRKPIVLDKSNSEEINSFLKIAKTINELKNNENKSIKFFEDQNE